MSTPEIPPLHNDVDFNAPLSDEHARGLITTLGPLTDRRVVDLGCGWAELLLRTLTTEPTATGIGVDRDSAAINHGRRNATARGLADRVELIAGDAADWSGDPVDVLINNGACHVWGGEPHARTVTALKALHAHLRPGGLLLFGEGFWQRPPTEAELAVMPMAREEYWSLADLVDLAQAHGFRLLALSQASLTEWDDFESRHGLGWETWLLANPDSPHAADIRAKADTHRTAWLRGWRDTLGFAYLTLVRT
ncbi:SAM-dependent methyltransferase [Actinokineospora sp.]|uniref:SAM-dependent methyltransferase n=1 Tax=Actinokineospora sp. TaxID=1872133 RepID=UPI0040379B08